MEIRRAVDADQLEPAVAVGKCRPVAFTKAPAETGESGVDPVPKLLEQRLDRLRQDQDHDGRDDADENLVPVLLPEIGRRRRRGGLKKGEESVHWQLAKALVASMDIAFLRDLFQGILESYNLPPSWSLDAIVPSKSVAG